MNDLEFIDTGNLDGARSWSFIRRIRLLSEHLSEGQYTKLKTKGFKQKTIYNSVQKVKKQTGQNLSVRVKTSIGKKSAYLVKL